MAGRVQLASDYTEDVWDLSDAAFRLDISAMCFSTRRHTDGFIPAGMLRSLYPSRRCTSLATELVAHGRWSEVDGGWLINGKGELWKPKATFGKSRRRIPLDLRDSVFRRDEHRCQECGTTERLSLDHVIPYSFGGPDTYENLRVLCRPCNSRKGARY